METNNTARKALYLGCTVARHRAIGIHAVINARGGRLDLNDLTLDEIEMKRDACAVRARIDARVRFYQVTSRFFCRHQARIAHLISDRNDC